MKFKTTQKAIKEGYNQIIKVGYCDLYYLLYFEEKRAYTCGVYGWNADVYDIDSVAIVTGYRPFGNIHIDYDIINNYNKKAEQIIKDTSYTQMDQARKKVKKLLNKFIAEALPVEDCDLCI